MKINDIVEHTEFPPFLGQVIHIDEQKFETKVGVLVVNSDQVYWDNIENFRVVKQENTTEPTCQDDCIDVEYTIS